MIDTRRTTLSLMTLAMILLVLSASAPAAAATRYVNGSCGSNAWSGLSQVCSAPNGPKATIQAAINASANGDEVVIADGTYTGPGNRDIQINGLQIVIRSAGGAQTCIIDAQALGRVFVVATGSDVVFEGVTIANGFKGVNAVGAGMLIEGSDAVIQDCVFTGNSAAVGGGLRQAGGNLLLLERCRFTGNTGTAGGGGMFVDSDVLNVVDCVFDSNGGGGGAGGVAGSAPTSRYENCVFTSNDASFVGAGMVDAGHPARLVNCVFSRNASPRGAGIAVAGDMTIVNCSFGGNLGVAVSIYASPATLSNCIVWGNTQGPFEGAPTATWSDIQGGWPGAGNIDADPLFVQPGTDDLRLQAGSPGSNSGSNALLPADDLDLDGDGNTTEPIPVDLDGNTRVQSGTVDMGAYEGAFASNDPAAGENDLDQGELVVLVPEGGPIDPVSSPAVLVLNTSGPDNASFLATQIDWDFHPGAGGFSELSSILQNQTTLGDGQYWAIQFIPFGILPGVNPQDVTLTSYDQATDTWVRAVSRNTVPEGDRIFSQDPQNWGVSMQTGDWGVFWDPSLEQGFAWANVDHESDFAIGLPIVTTCPADCAAIADGEVGIVDFLALLGSWGQASPGGACELNGDEAIDLVDMVILLESWGPCVLQSSPAPGPSRDAWSAGSAAPMARRSADLDGDGRVGRSDLEILKSGWGDAGTADLDGDGAVDSRDLLNLLAQWSGD